MTSWDRFISPVGGERFIVGLGGLYVALALGQAIGVLAAGDPIGAILIDIVLLGVPGLALLCGGYRLPRTSIRPEVYPRVAGWCLGGLGVLLGIVVLLVLNPAGSVDRPFRAAMIATGIGAVGGLLIGLNEARAISRAHEAEQQNRELTRYETLIEEATDVNAILDPDGTLRYLTPSVEHVLGYARDELVGTDAFTYIHSDDREEMRETFTESLEPGERSQTVEFRFEHADGSWIVFEGRGRNLLDDPFIEGIAVYTHDITERKRLADDLRQERDLRDRIVQTSPIGIGVVDADGAVTFANEHAAEIAGIPQDELTEFRYDEPMFTDTDADDESVFERILTTGDPVYNEESQITRADGEQIWLSVSGAPIADSSGDVTAVVFAFENVTEHKEHERELKRYKTIADTASDVIVTIDERSTIQSVNPAVEHVFGYERHELVGEPLMTLMPEPLRDRHCDALRRYLETGERTLDWEYIELTGRHRDGREIPLAIAFSEYEYGGRRFFTGIIRDNTDRKQLEENLRETVEKLEESNDRLEQFAYVASHDLQEPLRMVTSYLQLLEDRYEDDLDEDAHDFIEYAVDGAERMRQMINDLLAYSRIDTRADSLEPTDCDSVVDRALSNLQLQIEENDAEITVDSLPTVVADENQLEQVFQNFVSNALKYRGDEPLRIEIGAEEQDDEWQFHIEDNGIGIDPEDTDRIFEMFERLHTDEEYAGTGIGLPLCQKIVERHGGHIWVESEPGEGSTFYFTLSQTDGDAADGEHAV